MFTSHSLHKINLSEYCMLQNVKPRRCPADGSNRPISDLMFILPNQIKFFHHIAPKQPMYCFFLICLLYSPSLPFTLSVCFIFSSSCVGRNSASCAWLRTDRRTRCLSARNSSRRTAGKSARLPRTKSWSWNCTQSVCGQMDVWLRGGERQRDGEWENDSIWNFCSCFQLHDACNNPG